MLTKEWVYDKISILPLNPLKETLKKFAFLAPLPRQAGLIEWGKTKNRTFWIEGLLSYTPKIRSFAKGKKGITFVALTNKKLRTW